MPSINPSEAFRGGIKHPGVGPLYTLGLLGVTVVMALLPIIYLAFIAAVVYVTYWHATHNLVWVMGAGARIVSPRLWIIKFFIYATPIFVGAVLAFFMVKPFFARRIDQHQPYALNPQAEPTLYEFIWRICAIVGAPMPSLIELDCNLNAAAGLRYGFKSFFSQDLVLRIGLPLVAGLTAREFAGVLAHEFGHFTQGTALRLGYIIDRIDGWFGRVIYERDSWDERLEEMANEEEGGGAFMASCAQLGVWGSRKILTVLLLFGHAFSCYLSRRMEFHADQFQIRVGGSAAFERVMERLNTLGFLHQIGIQQMGATWEHNKRLPDNLPQFIVNMEGTQTGAKVHKALKGEIGFVKTGLFHTHPSDADRVRAARLAIANEPGIVTVDAPATELFENFPVPARIVTTLFYEGIGLPLGLAKLYEVDVPRPKEEAVQTDPTQDAIAAIDRYFSGVVTPLRPIFPRANLKIDETDIPGVLANIDGLPAQICAIAEQVTEACRGFDDADKFMLAAAQDDSGTAEGLDAATWRIQREEARRSLHSLFEAFENRLSSALSLAGTDAFANANSNAAAIRQNIASGVTILLKLQNLLKLADTLRVSTAALVRRGDATVAIARLREEIADIEAAMREVPCPSQFAKDGSLHQLFLASPAAQEPFIGPRAETLGQLPMAAYTRILGDLVMTAEQIVEQLMAQRGAAAAV